VVGANKYRNPDDDLPKDFEDKRTEYYEALGHPEKAEEFVNTLRQQMIDALTLFDQALPKLSSQVRILDRQGGWISLTPLTAQSESGSGKTTLLTLLGALDTPDSGEIWLHNQAVHTLRGVAAADFRREQVGFVFQLFYLLPHLTALENVMAPLLPYRRKLNFDLKQRAKELLEQVGLAKRMGHAPARLSGTDISI
jgi:predicted ABC-type transport system involved in lysophospholipase L1 biosynthesis ATPase subunit